MGIEKLITIAVTLATLAVSSGQLPRILNTVRVAQIQLLHDARASSWGQPLLLPRTK